MNIESIIAEVAAKQGVTLDKDDPLFVAILLNHAILKEYVREVNQGLTESITNVAIKEDVTLVRLRKLLDDNQVNNRKEIERTLHQFTDNLQGQLHSVINTVPVRNKPASWVSWLIVAFLTGILFGGVIMYYFTS